MKRNCTALSLFLLSLPVWAAQQTQDTNVPDAVEALSTPYIVIIGLIFVGILAGMWWYYMRWDDDDKSGTR